LPRPDLFTIFTRPLDRLGVPYFVTGSVAALVYGEPRVTHDVDVVLALDDAHVPALEAAFPEDDFYRPPTEVLRVELRRASHGHFNLIHHASGFKADVYLRSRSGPHAWAFTHRRRVGQGDDAMWLAPPEYVIARKLEYYREGRSDKHVRDIRAMLLALGPDGIDDEALMTLVRQLRVEQEWARVTDLSSPA
jgi:hypothetical protein